jgi:hypothetical protein
LIASVEDMSRYTLAQLNDGRYGATAILTPQGIAELHAPAISVGGEGQYALGWFAGTWDGIPVVWHSGNDACFLAIVVLMPERGSGVVLLSNANGFEQVTQVEDLAKGVVGMLNGKPSAPVSLPFSARLLYWIILLMPLLQLLGIAYSCLRFWRNKGIGHILLTVILYGTVALLWLFGMPQLFAIPIWPGLAFAYPEVAYGLIAGATLGIGWSVIYAARSLRMRRAK